MEQLHIKFLIAFALSICPSLCLGHDLAELIDKCDFVNFKKSFQEYDLSQEQRLELLNQVDAIIETDLKKMKLFFNGLPPLKYEKFDRMFLPLLLCFSGAVSVWGSFYGIYYLYTALKSKKRVANQGGLVAANMLAQNWQPYRQSLDALGENSKKLSHGGLRLLAISLLGIVYSVITGKWVKSNLISYKKYKKALKIKNLISSSMVDIKIV